MNKFTIGYVTDKKIGTVIKFQENSDMEYVTDANTFYTWITI